MMAESKPRQLDSQAAHEAAARGRRSPVEAVTERHLAWLTLVGLSVMFLLSFVWRPPDEPTLILCPFRALTEWLCPGCGMTRAFCALGHGELLRAVRFNALSPFLYLALMLVWVGAAATVFRLRRVQALVLRLRPNMAGGFALLALVLVWWVVRLAAGI
jgi:hypothetical protein